MDKWNVNDADVALLTCIFSLCGTFTRDFLNSNIVLIKMPSSLPIPLIIPANDGILENLEIDGFGEPTLDELWICRPKKSCNYYSFYDKSPHPTLGSPTCLLGSFDHHCYIVSFDNLLVSFLAFLNFL